MYGIVEDWFMAKYISVSCNLPRIKAFEYIYIYYIYEHIVYNATTMHAEKLQSERIYVSRPNFSQWLGPPHIMYIAEVSHIKLKCLLAPTFAVGRLSCLFMGHSLKWLAQLNMSWAKQCSPSCAWFERVRSWDHTPLAQSDPLYQVKVNVSLSKALCSVYFTWLWWK